MTRKTKRKSDTISISLPRRERDTALAADISTARAGGLGRFWRPSFLASAPAGRVILLRAPRGATRPVTEELSSRGRNEHWFFVVALAMLLAAGSLYVWLNIEDRQARFELTEMKQNQAGLVKVRERLNEQIATYKRLDDIAMRAQTQGLVQPDNSRVLTLP